MPDPNIITRAPNLAKLLSESANATVDRERLRDRSRGALLGLAVGNLLGLPVEGASHREIDRWHPDGVVDIDPQEACRPMDDDLAQAVDLGEALASGGDYVSEFVRRLIVWRCENGRGCGFTTSRVIEELDEGAPYPEAARIVYEELGNIAPNGGVMRCAPVAIARRRDPERLIQDSAMTCVATHYSPLCQWSGIVIDAVIATLLNGADLDSSGVLATATADGMTDLAAQSRADGISADIFAAIADGESPPADTHWLRRRQRHIGHTLLATQAGLWAAETPLDFESALIAIVGGGGDTDTNAAVAGAVMGARRGASAIPQRWIACIPQLSRIEALADDLAALSEA